MVFLYGSLPDSADGDIEFFGDAIELSAVLPDFPVSKLRRRETY
jgi:hypothetical protein